MHIAFLHSPSSWSASNTCLPKGFSPQIHEQWNPTSAFSFLFFQTMTLFSYWCPLSSYHLLLRCTKPSSPSHHQESTPWIPVATSKGLPVIREGATPWGSNSQSWTRSRSGWESRLLDPPPRMSVSGRPENLGDAVPRWCHSAGPGTKQRWPLLPGQVLLSTHSPLYPWGHSFQELPAATKTGGGYFKSL